MMRISDHALVRFLDRVAGLDVEGLRATLALSLDRAHRAAESLGAADYTVKADGLIYVIRDGVLVTVLGARLVHGENEDRYRAGPASVLGPAGSGT